MDFPHVDRFLRSVHRRLIFQRGAERVALCALIACAAALLLEPILLWRGLSAFPIGLAALLGAGGIGSVWGAIRRPTRLAAAMEADRQLQWADLLGTTLSIQTAISDTSGTGVRRQPDPWEATILAVAQDKCRQTSPSVVAVNRWGGRAWGGIGLVAALVLTVGFTPPRSARSDPGHGPSRIGGNPFVEGNSSENERYGFDARRPDPLATLSRPEDARDVSPNAVAESADVQPTADPGSHPTSDTGENALSHSQENALSHSQSMGQGTSSAQDRAAHLHSVQTRPPAADNGVSGVSIDGKGQHPAGGVDGSAADRSLLVPGPTGATAGSPPLSRAIPPWAGPDWAVDRDSALEAARTGGIPPRYGDVIREYFTRP